MAIYSPCGAHSLNLCGVHAAECCPAVITFFGIVQKLYNIFSSSPQRWDILKKHVGCSIHSMSQTRWSARIACIKPFAQHIDSLRHAVDDVLAMNITSDARSTLNGIKSYMNSFRCVLLASVWYKVLYAIDIRNQILQVKEQTLDVEVANVISLVG